MANEQTQNQEVDKNKILKDLIDGDPYIKGAYNASVKKGADDFNKAAEAEGGQAANQGLLQQLMQMTTQSFDLPGTKVGTGAAIGEFITGQGFNPDRPKQARLKPTTALSLMKMQQDQKGEALDTKEQKLNIQKLQALIQSQTPEGQEKQLQQDIKKAKTIEVTKRKEKLTFERKQAGAKIDQNFNTLVGQFKGLVGQAKGAGEEQGGLGLLPGFLGKLNVAFKNPNFSRTAALPGQIAETSLVFNSILTGQNRVIKGVVEMIQSTLLTSMDPGTTIADKTAQSLTNAFRIKTAFHKVGLTPDVLDRMTQIQLDNLDIKGLISSVSFTKEETAQLEGIIQDVLATPAVQQRQLPGFEQKGKGPKQAPIGKIQSRLDAIQKRKAEIQAELKG